jgi:hypothetical protein
VFTNLMSLSDHEMQVPVVVKLGHDCLQVASVGWACLCGRVKGKLLADQSSGASKTSHLR